MKMQREFFTEDMLWVMQYLRRIDATLIRLIPKRFDKSNGRGRTGYVAIFMVK